MNETESLITASVPNLLSPLLPLLQHDYQPPTIDKVYNYVAIGGAFIISMSSVLLYIEPSANLIKLFICEENAWTYATSIFISSTLVTGGVGANFGVTLFTAIVLLIALKQFVQNNIFSQIILKMLTHVPYSIVSIAAAYVSAAMATKTLFISQQAAWWITLVPNYIIADYSLTMLFDKHVHMLKERRLSTDEKNLLNLKRRFIKKIKAGTNILIKQAIESGEKKLPDAILTAINQHNTTAILTYLADKAENGEDDSQSNDSASFNLFRLVAAVTGVISLAGYGDALYRYFRTNEEYQWGIVASMTVTLICIFPMAYLSLIWGWLVPKLLIKPHEPASLLFPTTTKIFKGSAIILSFLSWAASIYAIVDMMVNGMSAEDMVGSVILVIIIALGTSFFNLAANLLLSDDTIEYTATRIGKPEQKNLIRFHRVIKDYCERIDTMSPEAFHDGVLYTSFDASSTLYGANYQKFIKDRYVDAKNTDIEAQICCPRSGLSCGII